MSNKTYVVTYERHNTVLSIIIEAPNKYCALLFFKSKLPDAEVIHIHWKESKNPKMPRLIFPLPTKEELASIRSLTDAHALAMKLNTSCKAIAYLYENEKASHTKCYNCRHLLNKDEGGIPCNTCVRKTAFKDMFENIEDAGEDKENI